MMKEITVEQFEQHKQNGDFFILDFYADWCEKCIQMMPTVEEISNEFPEVPIYKVNVDKFPEIKDSARIKAVPMLTLYNGGYVRDFAFGITDKEKITKKIKLVGKL